MRPYCLHRRLVRQAEEREVRRIEQLFPLACVLTLVLINHQQLDILPVRQTVVNLEASGPLFPINIYDWLTHGVTLHSLPGRLPGQP